MMNVKITILIVAFMAVSNNASIIISIPPEGQNINRIIYEPVENSNKVITTEPLDNGTTVAMLRGTQFDDYRKYVGGRRVNGDAVVGHTSKNQRYPSMQNVKVDLRYPASGYGKMVTFVEIAVNQTSSEGSAVITEGGIGQHFIGITVNALNTYQMDYSAIIYGI